MESDSTSLGNLLVSFPELCKELDVACKDALGRVANYGFQYSKEQVIIAEAFFNKNPGLPENDRRELIAFIKDVGNSKMLKARLKGQEGPIGGSPWPFPSTLKFLSVLKEQTSRAVDEAVHQSRDTNDLEFLVALPGKVLKEPLLEQLAQDVLKGAHKHFQEFMEWHLQRLYSHAHKIKQQMMHHQVELGEREQDQKRRASLRSKWVNEIKIVQAQVNPGCVLHCLWVYMTLLKCALGLRPHYLFTVLRRGNRVGWLPVCSQISWLPHMYLTFNRIQACC